MHEYMINIKKKMNIKAFNSSILLFSSYRREKQKHSKKQGKKRVVERQITADDSYTYLDESNTGIDEARE
jgi:hypothetical protein